MPKAKSVNFADKLIEAISTKHSRVVVGLDPRLHSIPSFLIKNYTEKFGQTPNAVARAFLEFNKKIIDAVADHVIAVKPQIAFYEQYGDKGIWSYFETIKYARNKGLLVIADVKRNDIGSTADAYAKAYLGRVDVGYNKTRPMFDADAMTVNPYLGIDGVKPFVDVARMYGKGIFILVRTSNPSAEELQGLSLTEGLHIFEKVALMVNQWGEDSEGENGYRSIGAVVGATYPIEAGKLRTLMPNCFFLVPGFGAQGAEANDVRPCFNKDGYGAIVNSSRGIIYAFSSEPEKSRYTPEEFALAAMSAANRTKEEIEGVLNN